MILFFVEAAFAMATARNPLGSEHATIGQRYTPVRGPHERSDMQDVLALGS
jgi:hypothetical protein